MLVASAALYVKWRSLHCLHGCAGRSARRAYNPLQSFLVNETAWIDAIPLWGVFILTLGIVLIPAEVGFRLGRYIEHRPRHETEHAVSILVAPVLALLAFILAFTFNLAQERYQARRRVQFDLANSLGTAYLRASFVGQPYENEIKRLILAELDSYIGEHDDASMRASHKRIEFMGDTLWRHATAAVATSGQPEFTSLLVQSLNQSIDLSERRRQIFELERIPAAIWLALAALTILSMGLMGYDGGMSSPTRSGAMVPLALAFCIVIFLIADLDRPHSGLLQPNREVLHELRSSLTTE